MQVVYRGQDGKKRIIAQRLEGTLDSAASFGGAPPPAPPAAAQQSFTITADGKRRITAMAVGITPRGAGLAQAGSQQPPSQASQWSNPPQSYTQYDAPVAAQPVVQYQYQYAPVALHSVDAGGMPPVQPLMAPQPGAKVVATLTTTAGGAVAAGAPRDPVAPSVHTALKTTGSASAEQRCNKLRIVTFSAEQRCNKLRIVTFSAVQRCNKLRIVTFGFRGGGG
jgi:hypothetical protein